MILSVVLLFASIMTVVSKTKDDTERVLQSYIIENSTTIYNSIKNGNDYTGYISSYYFLEKFREPGGTFDFDGTFMYNRNTRGGYVYKLTKPYVNYNNKNSLTLNAQITIYYSIEFAGKKLYDIPIPIKVKSSFNLKR